MAGITTEINYFNKDKWIVRFSNLVDFTELNLDGHILDNYVKSVNIPDLSISLLTSEFLHARQIHPDSRGARDLQPFTIEFLMDEKGLNFYYFWKWIIAMRTGKAIGKTAKPHGKPLLRMDCIDCIEICLLNNDNVMVSKMKFWHCIPTNLASISLETGEDGVQTFAVTFDYENLSLQPESVEE